MAEFHADTVTVFYYGSFLPVANGGNARVVDLLDRLAGEFGRVALYSYANHPDFPWLAPAEAAFRQRWPDMELVLEPRSRRLAIATRLKNLLLTVLPQRYAAYLLARSLPRATPRWRDLQRRSGAFVVSYAEGLTQLNGIDPSHCLVETHDVNFVKWAKLAGRRPVTLTALRKLRGEMTSLGAVRGLVAIAAGEAAFFRMMLPRPVAFVPRWSTAALDQPGSSKAEYDLVFVGSAYAMNVRGLCDLFDNHGDWLAGYRVAVCGHVAGDAAVQRVAHRHPNIVLLGFVGDLGEVYRRSRAAVSPVDGTGTKMKVLAALAAGLPVFASPQSSEGLPPGHEGAVFPITAEAVAGLLGSPERLRAAGARARHYHAGLCAAGEVTAALSLLRDLVPSNAPPARDGRGRIRTRTSPAA